MTTLVQGCRVEGRTVDVRIANGKIQGVAPQLCPVKDDELLDGSGATLRPGRHDHHVHLLSMAARLGSIDVSSGLDALAQEGEGWIRAVGLAADPPDRWELDRIQLRRPVRVQHRSGAVWSVNSAAADLLRLDGSDEAGIERDGLGTATGRLWRLDSWLRERLTVVGAADHSLHVALADVVTGLLSVGITGVTDATPDLDASALGLFRGLPLEVIAMAEAGYGPLKLMLHDHDLPSLQELSRRIAAARPRPVGIHVVSRESLLLVLAALDDIGRVPGDRLEHAAVIPNETIPRLVGLTVVTQPGFITARGDDYLRDVDADDVPMLYRYGSLVRAGVRVLPSSDAPFGPWDPTAICRAAEQRRTASGRRIGAQEAVTARTVESGYLAEPLSVAGPPRRVTVGAPADVTLVDEEGVRCTWTRKGHLWSRP